MAELDNLKKANDKLTKDNVKLDKDNKDQANEIIQLNDKLTDAKKKSGKKEEAPVQRLGFPAEKGGPVRVSDIVKKKEIEAQSKKKSK